METSKFDVKVRAIPNGLKKYMAFTINRNLVFTDSMQFEIYEFYLRFII